MLPASVVETLQSGQEVPVQSFDSATISYIDIVGFVALISQCSPIQVVDLLNNLYG